MKKSLFIYILLLFVPLFYGCNIREDDTFKYELKGDWAFILKDNSYGEVNISNDSITFFTELNEYSISYPYQIKKDTLYYNGQSYHIKRLTCDSYELCSIYFKFILNKLNLKYFIKDFSDIDPFYLRRCYYLMQEGKITMREALNYLDTAEQPVEGIKEEIILKNKKK